jgi:geranylgeranyl diphosphate synthase, type I
MTQTDPRPSPATEPVFFEGVRQLVAEPMRDALDRLDEHTRKLCGYHLGMWDADGRPSNGSGKGVRPALALLSARAAGAPVERGVPAAVACELVHNFSLVHDDVMDGDLERRHQPTVWARFGTSSAILAGDALLALANEVLAEAPTATAGWAIRCLNATTRRLIAGQQADLAFEDRDDVGLEECQAMAGDKTGALLGCAASLGAVLVDAPSRLALGLAEFGQHLGLAFQLVDDLLGIWGATDRTGKPVWSDLRSQKKSLPVVAALNSDTPAGRQFRTLYCGEAALTEDRLEEAAALVEAAGGRGWTERRVAQESAEALDIVAGLGLPAPVRRDLTDLTELLIGRDN